MKRRVLVTAAALGGGLAIVLVVARRRRPARPVPVVPDIDRAGRVDELTGDERVVVSPDGTELVVHVAGPVDGPTVVLAHCWTGSQQTWAPVARRLAAAGCRVVRWDQRGHGRSTTGDKGHSVEGLADDLACIMTELDLHDVVLVGHSMGGFTVQGFAVHHHDLFHDRTRATVLVATAAHGLGRLPLTSQPVLIGSVPLERAMRRPKVGQALVRGTFGSRAHPHHLEVTRRDFVATPGAVRSGFLVAFRDLDLREQVAAIDVPTTVICGSRDTLTPLPLSRALTAAIPGARLEVLAGYGHMLPFEAPDAIADAALAHLEAAGEAAPSIPGEQFAGRHGP